MEQLYREDVLTLATGKKKADFSFDSDVFERAAAWIRERGGFTPEMLLEKPARAVIDETFRILGGAVSSSVSTEMPDDLVDILRSNTFVFSGLKTFHSLSDVGLSLVGKDGGIKPFGDFHREVVKIDEKYNRNYLEAEYNYAVSSSQMASKWQDFEADGDRYDLQYRTADDDKVRAEHRRLNNITLPESDPFWKQFLPPNGWNCRCTTVQVRKGKYPTSDSARSIEIGEEVTSGKKQLMFRSNPGIDLKIYPDKHPYNKAPKEAKEAVRKLDWEREKALRKEVEAKVKEWFREKLPESRTVKSEVFNTGEAKFTSQSISRYLGHARTTETKWMLRHVIEHPAKMTYVKFSPLGSTKNMSDPDQAKNVAKKAKRDVSGYNIYEFENRGTTWIIGFELINNGEKSFEQPYYIAKKKP